MTETTEPHKTERRILSMMRKVLSAVAKDTAPQPGMRQPLSERTVQDIRDCLYVISARERELAESLGKSHSLTPGYVDEPRKSRLVSLDPEKKI